MINDDDLVGLAEDCISICEVLRIGIEGKNINDLSNLVKKAIADLERCAHSIGSKSWRTQIMVYFQYDERHRADGQDTYQKESVHSSVSRQIRQGEDPSVEAGYP